MRVRCFRGRRLAFMVPNATAVLILVAGCGDPSLLDPTVEPLAADRAELVDHMTSGLAAVGDQLGAGAALATRVNTSCRAGTDNWKIHDTYRSTCQVTVHSGFALDVGLAEALGGIDGLVAFEARLRAEGWGSPQWHLVGNAPGVGNTTDEIREEGRPVTDVTGVRLYSAEGDGTMLSIGFVPGSAPVEPSNGPAGGYYSDSQGEDWQDVWNAGRDEHALLIRGWGDATLAEQPW